MDEAWRRLLIGWRPAWYNFLGNKAICLRELLQDWPVKRTNRAETDKTNAQMFEVSWGGWDSDRVNMGELGRSIRT
jgi:hypothetical protein